MYKMQNQTSKKYHAKLKELLLIDTQYTSIGSVQQCPREVHELYMAWVILTDQLMDCFQRAW